MAKEFMVPAMKTDAPKPWKVTTNHFLFFLLLLFLLLSLMLNYLFLRETKRETIAFFWKPKYVARPPTEGVDLVSTRFLQDHPKNESTGTSVRHWTSELRPWNRTNSTEATENTTATKQSVKEEKLANSLASINFTYRHDPDLLNNQSYVSFLLMTNSTSPSYLLPRILIEPVAVCQGDNGNASESHPFLLILVPSGYEGQELETRRAIRDTYGSVARTNSWHGAPVSKPTAVVFVLGRPPSADEEKMVAKEQRRHGDMLIGDVAESHRNRTIKVLLALDWSSRRCEQTRFLLKADDDVFVNVPLLTLFLEEKGEPNSLYGHACPRSKVMRRGEGEVAEEMFPFTHYPMHMSGSAYVLSMDAAKAVVNASKYFPPLPAEGALVAGILPTAAGVRHISSLAFTHDLEKPDMCGLKKNLRFTVKALDKDALWKLLGDKGNLTNCTNL